MLVVAHLTKATCLATWGVPFCFVKTLCQSQMLVDYGRRRKSFLPMPLKIQAKSTRTGWSCLVGRGLKLKSNASSLRSCSFHCRGHHLLRCRVALWARLGLSHRWIRRLSMRLMRPGQVWQSVESGPKFQLLHASIIQQRHCNVLKKDCATSQLVFQGWMWRTPSQVSPTNGQSAHRRFVEREREGLQWFAWDCGWCQHDSNYYYSNNI